MSQGDGEDLEGQGGADGAGDQSGGRGEAGTTEDQGAGWTMTDQGGADGFVVCVLPIQLYLKDVWDVPFATVDHPQSFVPIPFH